MPGFWASADATEIQYLPPPPASLDEGPPGEPPTATAIWAPGCWMWQQQRYAWREGFWQTANPGWQWIPAHYVCTPRGCIYVEGYWDYLLSKRGVLFSPIFCPTRVYARPGFAYTPSVAIDIGLLVKNLFCCPGYDHYYFGDYYDARYEREGIFPWFESAGHHEYFDPIFAHRQWRNRDNRDWLTQVKAEYMRRQKDPDARPARTYSALQAQIAKLPKAKRNDYHVAQPLSSYVENKASPLKFQKVTPEHQAEAIRRNAAIQDFKTQRRTWEMPPALTTGGEHARPPVVGPAEAKPIGPRPALIKPEFPRVRTADPLEFTPRVMRLPPSPVVGPRMNSLGRNYAPPARPVAPRPNPDVTPRSPRR